MSHLLAGHVGCSIALLLAAFCLQVHAQDRAQISDVVHFGDIVDVDFVGSSDYDWRGAVGPDGTLSGFPTYESAAVSVVCRLPDEIAVDIAASYAKILRTPKVFVRILDRSGRPAATVFGAVKTPSRFRILRPVKLRELIVRSGGFTDDSGGEISIMRSPGAACEAGAARDNKPVVTRIKIADLLRGDGSDRSILNGDVVDVERAEPVYVIGAVNSPRAVFSRSELSVERAILMAGGFSKDAQGRRATVYRRVGTETTVIEVDLANRAPGQTNEPVLKPFDIIDVAGKAGRRRNFAPERSSSVKSAGDRSDLPLRVIER